jgi:2-methylcitrate dehydratase PrpD
MQGAGGGRATRASGPDRAQASVAVAELGRFVTGLDLERVPDRVSDALDLVLLDTLGVIVAGARTPEHQALVAATARDGSGPVRPLGTTVRLPVESAAFLDGTAACMLELDEGNKHARGHPAAHAVPVALALAIVEGTTAQGFREAVLAGHEVAARFGRAVRLRTGFHPHGNWGVAGAAAAAARLSGCGSEGVAGAIDAAAGMALAVPFDAALEGTFVRNTWTGLAAVSGLQSARLARAGLATNDGTAGSTFGDLIGTFDPGALTEELGERFDVELGYLKRHASCSFTHPPVDAALGIRASDGFDADRIVDVEVRTHGLAAPLARPEPTTRLAAMFSIPHLIAVALRTGRVDVEASGAAARDDDQVRALAARVRVVHDLAHDGRAPAERPALVRVTLEDGRVLSNEVPNPVGDADHHPLDRAAVNAKLAALIGADAVATIEEVVEALRGEPTRPAHELLDRLP